MPICYSHLTIAPRINGIVSIWKVRRQPSLSTSEPQLRLPMKAPAMNMLTTSPSRIGSPSKPSSLAIETIGPFITLQNKECNFVNWLFDKPILLFKIIIDFHVTPMLWWVLDKCVSPIWAYSIFLFLFYSSHIWSNPITMSSYTYFCFYL